MNPCSVCLRHLAAMFSWASSPNHGLSTPRMFGGWMSFLLAEEHGPLTQLAIGRCLQGCVGMISLWVFVSFFQSLTRVVFCWTCDTTAGCKLRKTANDNIIRNMGFASVPAFDNMVNNCLRIWWGQQPEGERNLVLKRFLASAALGQPNCLGSRNNNSSHGNAF